MNKFFSVAVLSLLITSATKNEAMAAIAHPFAYATYAIHKNPAIVPALAVGVPFAASLLYDNVRSYLPFSGIQESVVGYKRELARRIAGSYRDDLGVRNHLFVATVLATVGIAKLFDYCPSLRNVLIDEPLKKNPWLTTAIYGGAAAWILAGDKITQLIPDFGSYSSKQSSTE